MQTSLRFWQCLTNEHRQRARVFAKDGPLHVSGVLAGFARNGSLATGSPQEFSCHAIGKKGPDFVHFGTRMSGGCIGGRGAGEAGVYLFAAPVQ